MSETGVFSKLSDDVVLNILYKLEDDPRYWARIACVSTKFSSLIRTVCFRAKCSQSISSVLSDLLPSTASTASTAAPPGGWPSLYKLAVCCPGLLHSGVLIDNSDPRIDPKLGLNAFERAASTSDADRELGGRPIFDDLSFVTPFNNSDSLSRERAEIQPEVRVSKSAKPDFNVRKRKKICRSLRSHLASGIWNLSREQGNKLLASRFKDDCLYICDWPGCVHVEEKRNYMLFRGIFKNFKQSRVWRMINDGNKSKTDMNCIFCSSKQTWGLHSSFCLRRYFGYHDDGEPVVRAYVCENGHVSGAWTYWPLYA